MSSPSVEELFLMRESTIQEIARRSRWLIENRGELRHASSAGPYVSVMAGKVYIQDSGGVMSVHYEIKPDSFVEVYREENHVRIPCRVEYPDREFLALQELRRIMVLDELADV